MKYDFDDILIKPAVITNINSRSEVDVLDINNMLPIFTAPMDTVVDIDNSDHFINNGIRVILPRQAEYAETRISTSELCWQSYGIREFKDVFLTQTPDNRGAKMYALLDVANGHMPAVINTTIEAKAKYGDMLVLMVGNIANPETFRELSKAGADYIRVGIGNGGGCLTTVHTGVGYPMASLIVDTYKVSCTLKHAAYIVADGGFKKYSDVIKALALGADYVMLGSIFNKALESAGETVDEDGEHVNQYNLKAKEFFKAGGKLFKKFRGMSTKEVQQSWGKTNTKTSEGVVRVHAVEYTLNGWVDNFKHYLSSAMSYTDAKNLSEFIGRAKYNLITEASFKRYNK
mgnify:CR=1 FL=1